MRDATDENQVISAGVLDFVGAFEGGAGVIDQWYAVAACVNRHVDKAVAALCGKSIGDFLLVGGEHIDGIMCCLAEGVDIRRVVRQAPENQRGFERNGVEGADGDADAFTIGRQCSDDGNARGKAAERGAEIATAVAAGGQRAAGVAVLAGQIGEIGGGFRAVLGGRG